MGFAFPGSLGAKIAHPERRVLSINGDAGFLMNLQDLETAVRLELIVVAMIWFDGEYGIIKWKQQNDFDGRHSDLAFENPDLEALARAFGVWGRVLTGVGQIEEALRRPSPSPVRRSSPCPSTTARTSSSPSGSVSSSVPSEDLASPDWRDE